MDAKTWLGSLGEIKVAAKLTELEYDVFTQMSGKSPFDLVAYKDGILYRVSVKSTTSFVDGAWVIRLRSVRPNRTGNIIKPFDNTSCDILAAYIQPLDTVCFIKSDTIIAINSLSLREEASKFASIKSNIISDYLTI